MGKSEGYKKYDIFFHEFAHAIDYFYGNHKYFSKNSKIRNALFNDYENLRDSITLKESIAATQRLLGETKFSELYMDKTNQKSKILLSLNSRKLTLARDELGNFTSDQIEIMKDIKLMEIVRKGKNVNWGYLKRVKSKMNRQVFELSGPIVEIRKKINSKCEFLLEAGFIAETIQNQSGFTSEAVIDTETSRGNSVFITVQVDQRDPVDLNTIPDKDLLNPSREEL